MPHFGQTVAPIHDHCVSFGILFSYSHCHTPQIFAIYPYALWLRKLTASIDQCSFWSSLLIKCWLTFRQNWSLLGINFHIYLTVDFNKKKKYWGKGAYTPYNVFSLLFMGSHHVYRLPRILEILLPQNPGCKNYRCVWSQQLSLP